MKQNPELMQQFAQAAVSSIGKNPMDQGHNSGPQRHGPGNNPVPQRQDPSRQPQNRERPRPQPENNFNMEGPQGLDDIINKMNISPDTIPDLDSISLVSGESDMISNKSGGSKGITLNM